MRANKSVITAVVVGAGVATLAYLAPWTALRSTAQSRDGATVLAPTEGQRAGGIVCSEENGGCRDTLEAALAKRKPEGPVPRTKWDGKPDFNGVYYPQVAIARPPVVLESLYRPETRVAREKLQKALDPPDDTPELHCAPRSPSAGGTTAPHPVQLLQAPGVFVMVDEYFGTHRIIPTDGRPHSPAHKPSFGGDSVGHWEGDTLVVDVTNFNGFQWLDRGQLPTATSTALHVVERWTRPDAHTFEYEAVIEDPTMLTGPWTAPKLRRGRLAYDMVHESLCIEEFAGGGLLSSK